jgi:Na+/proline symporter
VRPLPPRRCLAAFSLTPTAISSGDKYSGHVPSSEEFSTAGRSIKVGLTACDIVSKWTWAATLLQSSNVAFQYGVSGPFWYASGATIQVLLFAVLAVEIKRKCPAIHTALEVVHARWGTGPHLVFMAFMLITKCVAHAWVDVALDARLERATAAC